MAIRRVKQLLVIAQEVRALLPRTRNEANQKQNGQSHV